MLFSRVNITVTHFKRESIHLFSLVLHTFVVLRGGLFVVLSSDVLYFLQCSYSHNLLYSSHAYGSRSVDHHVAFSFVIRPVQVEHRLRGCYCVLFQDRSIECAVSFFFGHGDDSLSAFSEYDVTACLLAAVRA